MQVEALVLGGDDGVLHVRRNLAHWNELVAQVIGPVMDPGFDAPFHVYGSGWRVDPLERHESQRCEQPASDDGDRQTSQN
jgi:hypothetical protein